MDAFVEEAAEATPELVEAMARLVPQLSRTSPPPTREELAEIVASPATVLFVARLGGEGEAQGTGGQIVGTLTLVLFRIPTAVRAWIEDVVVDGAATRQGVGEALTLAALERAADAGARTVDLTSRPSREAANRLYQRLGFALRETNVYRCEHGVT
ncbi:hypothetical protein BH18ACT1_BH18ACT1_13750 [soil metagenome]